MITAIDLGKEELWTADIISWGDLAAWVKL